MNPRLLARMLPALLFGAVVIVCAEVILRVMRVPAYVFPTPSQIVTAGIQARDILWADCLTTTLESVCGFALGSTIGLLLGVLLAESDLAEKTLLPYIVGSNAVPIVAVAPLVALWLGNGIGSKIVVAAFLCFFPLCIATYKGLKAAEPLYRDLFLVNNATKWQLFFKAQLPASSAFITAGAKLNATYAVIGAIVAEFVGSTSGLGFGMVQAAYNLATARLWAYLSVSVVLGIAAYATVSVAHYFYFRKFDNQED